MMPQINLNSLGRFCMDKDTFITRAWAWFIAACLAGAFINAGAQKDQTRNQRIFSFLGAFLAAYFLAPALLHHFNIVGESELSAAGFGVAAVWQLIYNKAVTIISGLNIPFFQGKKE